MSDHKNQISFQEVTVEPFELNFERTLQWMQTKAVDSNQCARQFALRADIKFNKWLQKERVLSDDVICALNEKNEGFCTGDSGSPLVSLEGDTLYGLVSMSVGCAR